ncbi:MAG: phosphatase PAP2 family protein [Acidiferrobacteraceae bacterium]
MPLRFWIRGAVPALVLCILCAGPSASANVRHRALPPVSPGPRLHLDPPSVGSAFVRTTLIGAAFGIADWGVLHRLDHPVQQRTSGIWSIARTPYFPAELIGGTALAALWEGGHTRFGRTLWQSLDGAALAGASTYALKFTFGRERPSQTSDPNEWFKGTHAQSFPSGDVSSITGLVTPMILEYRRSDPSVYGLALLPAFDMAARVEAHGHWQTDVVGGALVGGLSGYFAHEMAHPVILSIMPHAVEVGLGKRF